MASKYNIIKSVLGESYRSGGELLFYCPKCDHHKKKLSVNLDKDKFKCWVCDYRGNSVHRLVRRHGNFQQQQEWRKLCPEVDIASFDDLFGDNDGYEETQQKLNLPAEFRSLANKNASLAAKPARRFLYDRGVTRADILKWKMGYCTSGEFEERIIIPSFNMDGDVDYFVARSYGNNWKKYMNPAASRNIVFNELYVDWENDLSIVEGVFDAVVAGNAVPILGSSLREDSRLIQKVVEHDTPVYIALDPDAEKKAMRLIKRLLSYDVELYKVPIHPYSDVGEMSKETYLERKNAAVQMTPQTFLSSMVATI